jgi:hypothetical protein
MGAEDYDYRRQRFERLAGVGTNSVSFGQVGAANESMREAARAALKYGRIVPGGEHAFSPHAS